jgi:arylsulfatase A-like enzyme
VSYADVLFALGAGLTAAVLLLIVRNHPGPARLVARLFLAFGVFSVVYGVAGRQVFAYYAAPLTYQLLTLGGEAAKMESSLQPFVTVPALLALVCVPAGFVVLTRIGRRLDASRPPVKLLTRVTLSIVVIAWLALGRQFLQIETGWFESQDRHIAESPHSTFLGSLLLASPGARATLAGTEVRPEDVREFSRQPAVSHRAIFNGMSAPNSVPRPRNVILIVLESVGTRYLSLYGSKLNTTPRLMAEQTNAVVFERYYAPVAWTAYSLTSLVLAKDPPMERYNMTSFRTGKVEGESLAMVLRHAGYRTAFMAAGDPDWASAGFLERNGFQEIVRGTDLVGAKQVSSWGTADRFLFDEMLRWIDKRRTEPFFLMAWTDQTHHPYKIAPDQKLVDVVPAKDGKPKPLGSYLSLVHESDAQLGRLFNELRRRGLADSTLVVVTGDHGEAFGEPHGGNGHGFTVYDEEVRVPLVLWNPRLFRGGSRSLAIGSHPDLPRTVLDVLGMPAPPVWDGRSLFDSDRPPRTYFFAAAWGEYLLGVRDEDFKYIYDARQGQQELFNLRADPNEQKNLAATDTARARRLRQRLAAWLQFEQDRSASTNR